MKALLFTLLVIPILSCNQVGEKEPQITKADSIANTEKILVQTDTVELIKFEKGKELVLDSAQMRNIMLYVAYAKEHLPEIKMYAFYDYKKVIPRRPDENGLYFLRDNSVYAFSDTLIYSGLADGELGSSLLTVWKKTGDKYRFVALLEKSLITYAKVDSVFNLGKNKYLIAGTSAWGDAGEGAGSIWFAVWELPQSFRMIYYDKWFTPFVEDEGESKVYSYNYSYDSKSLQVILEKLVVNYKVDGYNKSRIHKDWKATKTMIPLDLSSKVDKTREFNISTPLIFP